MLSSSLAFTLLLLNDASQDLCLSCGFCCNGVIFADIKLQRDDDLQEINRLRLQHGPHGGAPGRNSTKILQPCLFFDGTRCRIYDQRPHYCREFECLLLRKVTARQMSRRAALGIIRIARSKAGKVDSLLRSLGDTDVSLALARRFKRTSRRMEQIGVDARAAQRFGELTLAMHDLNRILAESFYPG